MEFEDFKNYMVPFFDTLKNVSEKVDDIITDATAIKIQTTKTNGRVNALEDFRDDVKASKKATNDNMWKVATVFLGASLTVIGSLFIYFIINHYKN